MSVLKAVNRKARKMERAVSAVNADVQALQARGGEGKILLSDGLHAELHARLGSGASGGTAGLCQPVERDLFDCYLGCGWPRRCPTT